MRPLRPIAPRSPAPGADPRVRDGGAGARAARRRTGLRRRSLLVRVLRVLAPLAMAALAAVLVGWIVGRAHKHERSDASRSPISIHMSSPRFLGRDSRGRAYVLTGSDAVRDEADAHMVRLASPRLALDTEPGRQFVVTALTGVYRDDTRQLSLKGDVVVKSRARGEGPTGTIVGDAYALSDHGDHATFTGRVKSRLYNGTPPAPAPASGAGPARKRP